LNPFFVLFCLASLSWVLVFELLSNLMQFF